MSPTFKEHKIDLWPGVPPGSEGLSLVEDYRERGSELKHDRSVGSIGMPAIYSFLPEKPDVRRTGMLICPGGAYGREVIDREGFEVAAWLNGLGIASFVLKYRLPGEGHANRRYVPLQDAQRAIRVIRSRSVEWNVNPHRLGVIGFSAGGHLAATLGVNFRTRVYEPVDKMDGESARPDFVGLVYPLISVSDRFDVSVVYCRNFLLGKDCSPADIQEMSLENHVTAETPETFIVHAHDDTVVSVENSTWFYAALKKAGVNAELHVFRNGGHGFGEHEFYQTTPKLPVGVWPKLFQRWLESLPGQLVSGSHRDHRVSN